MKVWLVMANDAPDSVFGDKENADAFAHCMDVAERKRVKIGYPPRIYWRVYEFTVQVRE
jgi:hypothetical protein